METQQIRFHCSRYQNQCGLSAEIKASERLAFTSSRNVYYEVSSGGVPRAAADPETNFRIALKTCKRYHINT